MKIHIKNGYIDFCNVWSKEYLLSDLRHFTLKYSSDKILLNDQHYHFASVAKSCKLCLKVGLDNPPDKTWKLIIMDCPTVQPLNLQFFRPMSDLLGNINRALFLGSPTNSHQDILIIEILIFLYYLYNLMRKNRILSFAGLMATSRNIWKLAKVKSYSYIAKLIETKKRCGQEFILQR